MSMLVRLKPYVPGRGMPRRHTISRGDEITLFEGGARPLWYEVDDDVADELRLMVRRDRAAEGFKDVDEVRPEDGQPLFDVCTKREAQKLEDAEERKRSHGTVRGATRAVIRTKDVTAEARKAKPKRRIGAKPVTVGRASA